jgi:hypothetical protein
MQKKVYINCLCGLLLSAMIGFFITGCEKKQDDNFSNFFTVNENDSQEYQAEPALINEHNILINVKLKSNLDKGELILLMKVENRSGKKIMVDYINGELMIDQERAVIPEVLKEFKTEIPSEGEEYYEINYHPINSIEFYNNTNYWGDMKQTYTLKLNFITHDAGTQLLNEQVVFKLEDTAYKKYLATYARERHMAIFQFDFDSKKFDVTQANYLNEVFFKDAPRENDERNQVVFSINPELIINRMIFNIFSYKEKDTLIVNMRMLNEDTLSLKVIPAKCLAEIPGNSYAPCYIFSDTFTSGNLPDSAYIFKPGTRLHLLLKYHIPEKFDHWEFNSNWLLMKNKIKSPQEAWRKLLCSNLRFKQLSVLKNAIAEY